MLEKIANIIEKINNKEKMDKIANIVVMVLTVIFLVGGFLIEMSDEKEDTKKKTVK